MIRLILHFGGGIDCNTTKSSKSVPELTGGARTGTILWYGSIWLPNADFIVESGSEMFSDRGEMSMRAKELVGDMLFVPALGHCRCSSPATTS